MKILAINCGSSTLKFQFMEIVNTKAPLGQEQRIAQGTIDRIGGKGRPSGLTQLPNTATENIGRFVEAVSMLKGTLLAMIGRRFPLHPANTGTATSK